MPTSLEPLDVQAGLYPDGVGKFNEYDLVPGVCILPVAEDPPTSASELRDYSPVIVARLHAPYRIRRVRYDAKKDNNPPVGIPAPDDAGKFVFVGGTISVQTRVNSSLVNYDWNVGAEYLFVENCVSRVEDGFVLGSSMVPPAMAQENAQTVGGNVFAPAGSLSVGAIGAALGTSGPQGAIVSAGVDAKTGYRMAQTINFFGRWGYNQDSFLPGEFFNDRIVNGDLNVQPTTAELRSGG